jgi:hypothetical protein
LDRGWNLDPLVRVGYPAFSLLARDRNPRLLAIWQERGDHHGN